MYTLSDEDMKEVEKRVLIAYGMYQYIHNFDMIYTFDQLNSFINGIVNSRVKELMQSKDYCRVSLEDMKNTVDKLVKDYRDDNRDSNSDKDNDSHEHFEVNEEYIRVKAKDIIDGNEDIKEVFTEREVENLLKRRIEEQKEQKTVEEIIENTKQELEQETQHFRSRGF